MSSVGFVLLWLPRVALAGSCAGYLRCLCTKDSFRASGFFGGSDHEDDRHATSHTVRHRPG
jgi:hypothetical protein